MSHLPTVEEGNFNCEGKLITGTRSEYGLRAVLEAPSYEWLGACHGRAARLLACPSLGRGANVLKYLASRLELPAVSVETRAAARQTEMHSVTVSNVNIYGVISSQHTP